MPCGRDKGPYRIGVGRFCNFRVRFSAQQKNQANLPMRGNRKYKTVRFFYLSRYGRFITTLQQFSQSGERFVRKIIFGRFLRRRVFLIGFGNFQPSVFVVVAVDAQ